MDARLHDILAPKLLLQERYRIVRLIGRGGMGAVYEATDLRLKIPVAIKQTLVAGAPFRKAFQREALLLARLRHPALPVLTDYFAEGEAQFLVMQYMPGPDLAALHLRRGHPFPLDSVLDWADQLLEVIEYLHEQEPPVIHRDIKPQNIKLTAAGAVVLLDFGLAKGAATLSQVASSSLFGFTPHYAPLEQIRGGGTNARSDLYATAATLYHLLSAGPPASAMERAEAAINEQADPLAALSAINPDVPEPISALLMQALALRADARPASAGTMRAALAAARAAAASQLAGDEPDTVVLPRQAERGGAALIAALEHQTPGGAPAAEHTTIEQGGAQAQLPSDAEAAEAAAFDPSPAQPAEPARRRVPAGWIGALGLALLLALGIGIPILGASQSRATATPAPAIVAPPTETRTASPTTAPTRTASPTTAPTRTASPTTAPSPAPSSTPTRTARPTARPRSAVPAAAPTSPPPTEAPTNPPPTAAPTSEPSAAPRRRPTNAPITPADATPTDEPTSDAYPGPATPSATAEVTADPNATPDPNATADPQATPSATTQPTARPSTPTP